MVRRTIKLCSAVAAMQHDIFPRGKSRASAKMLARDKVKFRDKTLARDKIRASDNSKRQDS